MLGGLDYHSIAVAVRRAFDGLLGSSGSDGYEVVRDSTRVAGGLWMPPSARAVPYRNVRVFESHSSNAVTYTLKGEDGNDLSATNPGFIFFPSATLTSGAFDIVKLTANVSVTVSSGSTLGHASAIAQHTFIYALKTGSTAELFVSNLPPDYPGVFHGVRLISTTAEGGLGAADSATGLYSTTARSNVAWVPLAKVKGTQTTAGTWAADPTQIDMAPFTIELGAFSVYRNAARNIATLTATNPQCETEDYDPDSTYDAATNYRHQPKVAGVYRYMFGVNMSSAPDATSGLTARIYKNGSQHTTNGGITIFTSGGSNSASGFADILLNGTTDYVEPMAFQDGGGTESFGVGSGRSTYFVGSRLSGSKS